MNISRMLTNTARVTGAKTRSVVTTPTAVLRQWDAPVSPTRRQTRLWPRWKRATEAGPPPELARRWSSVTASRYSFSHRRHSLVCVGLWVSGG
jgi:hypothetical protein